MDTKNHNEERCGNGDDLAERANQALCDLNQILDVKADCPSNVKITVDGDNRIVQLPRELAEVVRAMLASTAAGRSVTVIPTHAEFTTQQAAGILNVSRPYLIKLLDAGEIDYRKVGTHRRILANSLHEYEKKMELESKQAADELTELSEELGFY